MILARGFNVFALLDSNSVEASSLRQIRYIHERTFFERQYLQSVSFLIVSIAFDQQVWSINNNNKSIFKPQSLVPRDSSMRARARARTHARTHTHTHTHTHTEAPAHTIILTVQS